MPYITFTANGGEAPGYLAEPGDGHGPGVVVLQEWWGLDDHIRSVCDRLAPAGSSRSPPTSTAANPQHSPTRHSSA